MSRRAEQQAPRGRRPRGQALAEFALVFPVFFLVLMGMIDGGRLVYTDATLSQAAREAARVAAVEAGWIGIPLGSSGCVATRADIGAANPGAHVCPTSVASMKADIVAAANTMVAGLGTLVAADVFLSCNTGQPADLPPTGDWTEATGGNGCVDAGGSAISSQGDVVSVRIAYTFNPVTPLFSAIGFAPSRSGSATMVVN